MRTEEIIKTKLAELEKEHGIRILFACESGSRAWGFPSPDSDYDARFIYAHREDWYLSINEKADVIELPINGELDINGWDLRKALRLMAKHNAVVFEWMQSPVIYGIDNVFIAGLRKVAPSCFSPIAAMHHYLSMSKRYYAECQEGETVKLKKYLYCLRTSLASEWIAALRSIPPMELGKLLTIIDGNKVLQDKISELVKLKATKDESYMHPRDKALEKFLGESIERCSQAAPMLPAAKADTEAIDELMRNTISNKL